MTVIGRALREELMVHRVLLFLVGAYVVFALALGYRVGRDVDLFLYIGYLVGALGLVGCWAAYLRLARLLGQGVRRGLVKRLYTDLKGDITANQIVAGGLLFLLFTVFFSAFQSVKMMIPAVKPFAYDVLFAEMDRVLHFGIYPHELLQPLMGNPLMTMVAEAFYNVWFLVMMGVLAWQMLDRREPSLRMRFLVSFTLTWFFLGSLAAIHLSSAGPVYFDRVTGLVGPYSAHMEWLWSINEVSPVLALDLQELLWDRYSAGEVLTGSGISAMPSMHVSIAALLFLFSRHLGRWARWAGGVFLVGILLASVHLGWHYAVDGYLGIVMVAGIWWSVGRFYKREVPDAAFRAGPAEVSGA